MCLIESVEKQIKHKKYFENYEFRFNLIVKIKKQK